MSITFSSPFKFDTITRYLSWDHDRLDGLLGEATRRVEEGQFKQARSIFLAFEQGLRRHIRVEEEILFPIFESRTGTKTGPTLVMRAEHRLIEAELTRMSQALEVGDASEYGGGLSILHGVLGAHNLKEENVLYPTTDDLLTPAERLDFVDRLSRG
jgi:iron-sulfur cluster repair protein YtfE (RIC family)